MRAKIELIFINTSAAAKRRRILERGYGDDKSGKKIDKDGEGRCEKSGGIESDGKKNGETDGKIRGKKTDDGKACVKKID